MEYNTRGALSLSVYNADSGLKMRTIMVDKNIASSVRLAITKATSNPSLIVNDPMALEIILTNHT